MKNKRLITMSIALLIAASLSACGQSSAPAPSATEPPVSASSEASSPESSEAPADITIPELTAENPIFVQGEMPKIEGPVLIVSAGRSSDSITIMRTLDRAGIKATVKDDATPAEIAAAKTVLVAPGASMKGLGSAGISVEDELARSTQMLKDVPDDVTLICMHVGGAGRRGETSDPFISLVLPLCDALIAMESGNSDFMMTDLAIQNDIPFMLGHSGAALAGALKDLAE